MWGGGGTVARSYLPTSGEAHGVRRVTPNEQEVQARVVHQAEQAVLLISKLPTAERDNIYGSVDKEALSSRHEFVSFICRNVVVGFQ